MINKLIAIIILITSQLSAQLELDKKFAIYSFGEGGNLKMLYDRRQRPQALKEGNEIYLVYNGNKVNEDEKPKTMPIITSFNLKTKTFGNSYNLGSASSDHHYCPIIWADKKMKINVFYGAHNSQGIHLISKNKLSIGKSMDDWEKGTFLETPVSYPSFSTSAFGDIIYFRNGGHTTNWRYAQKKDNEKYWTTIDIPTTDLDISGMFEWSSYHSYILSDDKKFMHIAFISYDDNKENNPGRYFNERYNSIVTNDYKYNLYYLKIDLQTQRAYNFVGKSLKLPIDLHTANKDCIIWNTEGRGSGIPPQIIEDKNGNPAFLHVITEENINKLQYYFVKFLNKKWTKSPIRSSNHQWNNADIIFKKNKYHAYLITGDKVIKTPFDDAQKFLNQKGLKNWTKINELSGGYMDKHGGGQIEEWVSEDGINWNFYKKIVPENTDSDWRFNNIQFIKDRFGNQIKDAFIFYGWNISKERQTSGFLYLDN